MGGEKRHFGCSVCPETPRYAQRTDEKIKPTIEIKSTGRGWQPDWPSKNACSLAQDVPLTTVNDSAKEQVSNIRSLRGRPILLKYLDVAAVYQAQKRRVEVDLLGCRLQRNIFPRYIIIVIAQIKDFGR